jgi:dihydrofolate reductase
MEISIIAAVSVGNRAIGYNGGLCYQISEDLAMFRRLTMGHPIIMGSTTYKSLPAGALPGRRNIVITSKDEPIPGCDLYKSLTDAISSCSTDDHIFIIGGAMIYKTALPLVNTLYLTEIFDTPRNCDTFFPPYHGDFICVEREYHMSQGLRFEFTKYIRND